MFEKNGYGNGELPAQSSGTDVPVRPFPAWTPARKLKIITIGAGFSAMIFAHKLQHKYPEFQDLVEHRIFEARNDVGGTWLVNKYPGVQCDVPAHIYVRLSPCFNILFIVCSAKIDVTIGQAFPFDPKTNWDHFYAKGQDIQDYIKTTVKKWNLDRDVRLNHKVLETAWQEDLGQWKVTGLHEGRTFVEYADFLVAGQGVLR